MTEAPPLADGALSREEIRRMARLLAMGRSKLVQNSSPEAGHGWPSQLPGRDGPEGTYITFQLAPEIPGTFGWRQENGSRSEHRGRITHIRVCENGVWLRISNPAPAINDGRTNPAIVKLVHLTHVEQEL